MLWGRSRRLMNCDQKATVRQLSLVAHLLFSGGKAKDEIAIREIFPPYQYILNILHVRAKPGSS